MQPSEFIDTHFYPIGAFAKDGKKQHANRVSKQSRLHKGLKEGESCHVHGDSVELLLFSTEICSGLL